MQLLKRIFAFFLVFSVLGCLTSAGGADISLKQKGLKFEEVGYFSEGLVSVKQGGKYGFANVNGEIIIPPQYDKAEDFSNGLAVVCKNDKWGSIDKTGKIIIPIKYGFVMDAYCPKGFLMVGSFDKDLRGVYNSQGKIIVPTEYYDVEFETENLIRVCNDYRFGAFDTTGKMLVPCEYDDILPPLGQGLIGVEKGGKFGAYSNEGELVVPVNYDSLGVFYNGMAAVKKGGKLGFIDKSGDVAIPFIYEIGIEDRGILEFTFSQEGLAAVKKNGKWGYIDKSGKTVIPFEYDNATRFVENVAGVKKGEKWGCINSSGDTVIPFAYDGYYREDAITFWFYNHNRHFELLIFDAFDDSLIIMRSGEMSNFYDQNCNLLFTYALPLINVKYIAENENSLITFDNKNYYFKRINEEALPGTDESNIFAYVKKGEFRDAENEGILDKTGKLIIDCVYEKIWMDTNECFIARKDDKYTAFNERGERILYLYCDNLICITNSIFAVKKDNQWTVIDSSGKAVLPFKFQDVRDSGQGIVWVQHDKEWEIYVVGSSTSDKDGEAKKFTESQPEPDNPSSWAAADVTAAIYEGLVPESLQSKYARPVTRAEFCALAAKLYETVSDADIDITGRRTFNDINDENVEKMAALGVVNGMGGNMFSPKSELTREQVAVILTRLADAIGKPLDKHAAAFADNGSISSWAFDSVGQVQSSGIMSGIGNNTFAPKNPYTTEQSIVTLLRLYDMVK